MQIPIFTFCKLMNNFTTTICSNIIKNGIYVCIYIYKVIYEHRIFLSNIMLFDSNYSVL